MSAVILRGDARHLPLADASVDLIVTSPPYWSLRSYQDGGEHYDGQIGAEPTPGEYIAALLECTREWMRVLKPEGSLWINLGDKYSQRPGQYPSGNANAGPGLSGGARNPDHIAARRGRAYVDMQPKCLIGLPWRYALGCIDDLGLILRAEVIWSKPSGMPESVTDRVRRAHEQFFHFTKQPRYYAAVDEIREPAQQRTGMTWEQRKARGDAMKQVEQRGTFGQGMAANPLGRLPGSVWEVATQPLKVPKHLGVDHFAAFPPKLIERIILGWSPPGICTACGEGRRPVTDGGGYDPEMLAKRGTASQEYSHKTASGKPSQLLSVNLSGPEEERYRIPHRITGYTCACPTPGAPTRPAVVLDPFGGTGTTALVADVHGRHGISIDRSADYCRLATWRVNDPGERARALGVPKPPPVVTGQGDLFEGAL